MSDLLPHERPEYLAFWEFFFSNDQQFRLERYDMERIGLACFKAGIEFAKRREANEIISAVAS